MNRHTRTLELHKILERLAELCASDDAKKMAREIAPAATYREAVREMRVTADAHNLTNRYGTPSIYGIRPCAEAVKRARVGGVLSMRELLDVATILRTARSLIQWKKQSEEKDERESSLDYIFSQLTGHKPLEEDIAAAILSEEEISDQASPELADIRRKIRLAGQKIRDQLDKMIHSSSYSKYLQEQIVTLRGGRFVVPVKQEHRAEVKGLVHDTSSSGATLFVEPMAVVEQNNQIRELESKERNEIDRILREFSSRVGDAADLLLDDYDMILLLDLIFAKSKLADDMRATVPNLIEGGETRLMKARHPLIDRDKIVPIDIYLGGEFSTLVITGPNTGGKTVALKTLGLLTLMAMCGLMLPVADDSAVSFYRKVLADIGDEQSIEQSLSTFSGHMTNIVSILSEADSDALVLIDELGAGTDPVEGAALAVAILTELAGRGAKIAATTHYAEIKMYALQTDGVENASCEFDVATLRPTYRLLIGVPGRSNAFAISERLGLPTPIIEAAKEQVSHENARFEDVVSGLEETRQQLEREKAEAEHYRREAERAKEEAENIQKTLESRIETEMAAARDKARGFVERMKFQSENLLNELEELKKQKDKADFSSTVGDIRKTFGSYVRDMENAADPVVRKNQPVYRLPRKLKRGDRVMVTDLGAEGTCLQDQDDSGSMMVQTGIIKTKVKVSTLRLIDDKKRVTVDGGGISTKGAIQSAKNDTRWEVDLRGMDSGEAIMTLDQYIDSAILSGYKTVSIIHGKGTGVLRTAVQNRLRKHKSVKSFRNGTYGEGDAGVTIAELK